jgi:hypothetical protein
MSGILSPWVETLMDSIRVIFLWKGITSTTRDERSSPIDEIVSGWDAVVRNRH